MKFLLTGAALFWIVAANAPEVEVAAADQCHQQCQAIENQCRLKSKDLDSSKCQAMFLECIANCKQKR